MSHQRAVIATERHFQSCRYLENGDLFNALHRERKANITWYRRSNNPSDPLPAQPVPGLGKRIALDIARGLHFLHTHRIVSQQPLCSALNHAPPPVLCIPVRLQHVYYQ